MIFNSHIPIDPAAMIKRETGVSRRLPDAGGDAAGEDWVATSEVNVGLEMTRPEGTVSPLVIDFFASQREL
jgi:hypothetical protein